MKALQHMVKGLLPLLLLAALPACSTYSLEELRHTPPKGTPFQSALALEYLRFAEDESRNVDWADAGYFSEKGLRAAYGNDVQPEVLADWYIPLDSRPALEEARTNLMAALTPEHIAAHPDWAARAQLDFDCWVLATHGGWSGDRTAECRDGLTDALKVLNAPPETEAAPPPGSATDESQNTMSAEQADSERQPPQEAAYIVFFATNQSTLDAQAAQIVDKIVEDIKKEQPDAHYSVVLNGHTDTVGSARYNFDLSKRRAEAVKKALLARGISQDVIRTFGFGKTDLMVKTPDNTAEPKNRRVEIFFGE